MTTASPNTSAGTRFHGSGTTANQKEIASSPAGEVSEGRTSRHECSAAMRGSPMMGRDSQEKHAGYHGQTKEGGGNQSDTITRVTGDASAQQPHCFSRFEPALPSATHTDADHTEPGNDESRQRSGVEGLGLGVINVADTGLKFQKSSKTSGNAKYPHPLADPVNAGDTALIELASRTLETQKFAAARSSQNLQSIARQAWDSREVTGPERAQTRNVSQPSGSSTSPIIELSPTSTEESAHAENSESSQGAAIRPRGPSALRPLTFGQLQRDSRKTLQDFEGEFFKIARKTIGVPTPTGGNSRHESSSRWLPANRSAGGRDRTRSSSFRETQGPLPEPVCLNCRKKKRRCDRQKPRCECFSSTRTDLLLTNLFRWILREAGL